MKSIPILFACLLCTTLPSKIAMAENVADRTPYRVPELLFSGEPRGPYATGTFEQMWVNDTADDPNTRVTGYPRKILVQIWYPATKTRTTNAQRAPYAISPDLYAKDHWVNELRHVKTDSFVDAPLASCEDRLPVLIYSHGAGHPHFSATFQTEFLASHCYVVVAIGRPDSNEMVRFPDGTDYVLDKDWNKRRRPPPREDFSPREKMDYEFVHADLSHAIRDTSFVLDTLTDMNSDKNSRFYRRLDLDRVGALGWSLGGFISLQSTRQDQRIKAAANLDGWPYGLLGPQGVATLGSERPVLLMFGLEADNPRSGWNGTNGKNTEVDADEIETGMAADTHYWRLLARTKADWYHIRIKRTNHGSFSDVLLFEPYQLDVLHPRAAHAIINGYVLEFFNKYVKKDQAQTPLLAGNQSYPDAIVLRKAKAREPTTDKD